MTSLILSLPLLSACGGSSGDGGETLLEEQPFFQTLRAFQQNGMPTLDQILPALPDLFSQASGVQVDENGLPALPKILDASALTGSAASIAAAVNDASALAGQGFSEARRVEASVQNLLRPIFNVLGKNDLFAAVSGTTALTSHDLGGGLIYRFADEPAASSGGLFDQLMKNLRFAVPLSPDGQGGLPTHLLLSAERGADSFQIDGLWPDGAGNYATGFSSTIKFENLENFAMSFVVSPRFTKGLVGAWRAETCENDLYEIGVSATDGVKALAVKSLECPDSRSAASALSIAQDTTGVTILGSFAETFPEAKKDTLRGWLGAREGVVLQARTSKEMDKMAAAVAVMGESDFTQANQGAVDSFGIGQMLSRFVQDTYWAKEYNAKSKESSIAHWLCESPYTASMIQKSVTIAKDLCANKPVDSDALLSGLTTLRDTVGNFSFAIDEVAQFEKTLDGIISVLSMRNSLFIAKDQLAYMKAPDESFTALDEARSAAGVAQLANVSWTDAAKAKLPNLAAADMPTSPLAAITSGLSGYLAAECSGLVTSALAKSGKASDSAPGDTCKF